VDSFINAYIYICIYVCLRVFICEYRHKHVHIRIYSQILHKVAYTYFFTLFPMPLHISSNPSSHVVFAIYNLREENVLMSFGCTLIETILSQFFSHKTNYCERN